MSAINVPQGPRPRPFSLARLGVYAFLGVMALLFVRLPTGFLPDEDQGFIYNLITLPPGTTQTAPEGPNMSYLRYLWQAVHTPGVTLGDALMLIAQRPMDAKSAPPSSPTAPVAPSAEQANAPVAPATALPVSP